MPKFKCSTSVQQTDEDGLEFGEVFEVTPEIIKEVREFLKSKYEFTGIDPKKSLTDILKGWKEDV
jgi:hypothetical protein